MLSPRKMEVEQDSTAYLEQTRHSNEDLEVQALNSVDESPRYGLTKRRGLNLPAILPGPQNSDMEREGLQVDSGSEPGQGIHLTPLSPSSIRSKKSFIDSGEALFPPQAVDKGRSHGGSKVISPCCKLQL